MLKKPKSKCPKCGAILRNSKSKKKDINFLSLNLLLGIVSLKRNKKGMCDLCGERMNKR